MIETAIYFSDKHDTAFILRRTDGRVETILNQAHHTIKIYIGDKGEALICYPSEDHVLFSSYEVNPFWKNNTGANIRGPFVVIGQRGKVKLDEFKKSLRDHVKISEELLTVFT